MVIETSGELLVDREVLLDRVGGDEDLLQEITNIFLEEYPALLTEIRGAVAGGNAKALESAAHSLKGAVANFGATAATQAALELELIGRRGTMAQAPSALATLEECFEALKPSLLALIR